MVGKDLAEANPYPMPTAEERQAYNKVRNYYDAEDLLSIMRPDQYEIVSNVIDILVKRYQDYVDFNWYETALEIINEEIVERKG